MANYTLYDPFIISASIVANDGFATVTLGPGVSEQINSYGSASMFDDRHTDGTSEHFQVVDVNSADEIFTITFNPAIPSPGNSIKLVIVTRLNDTYSVRLNEDANLDSGILIGNPGGTTTKTNTIYFDGVSELNSIKFTMGDASEGAGTWHEIQEVYIYTADGINISDFEFNDSVLTTKGWNSSRYDGRQLQGAKINEYTNGDITYGKTPVIRNYSNNIYLATEIVSLSKTGSAIEDDSLQYIPNFSYILIDKIITVNGDDTLTQVSLNSISNEEELKGLNREFQSNIPIGSTIGFNNFDESVKNRSNQKYTVYFNRGRLQPILRFTGNPNISASGRPTITTSTLSLWSANTLNGEADGIFTPRNEKLIQDFYTGSIDTLFRGLAQTSSMSGFFNQLLNYKEISGQRYFITVLNTSGSNFTTSETTEPIRTITTDAISNATLGRSRNLAEISTTEIMEYNGTAQIQLDNKHRLNRLYSPGGTQGDIEYYSGSFDISALNEEKLSLLINMNKETEFPDGKGLNPIVIVPENIHPYVKDNLVHFLIKAGINIGDRKIIPVLDESRRLLK